MNRSKYAENVDDATNMDVDSQSNDNVDSNLDVDELTQHLDHTEKIFTQNFPLHTAFPMKDNLFELTVRLRKKLCFILSVYSKQHLKCNHCNVQFQKRKDAPKQARVGLH